MFTILDENYSHADFKTRVLGCYGFVKAILEYTHLEIDEMQKLVHEVNVKTAATYHREKFALSHKNEKLTDITIKSYEFTKEKIKPEDRKNYPSWYGEYHVKPTKKHKDYTMPYFTKAVPTKEIELPAAYILPPGHDCIIARLREHGIVVEKVRKEAKVKAEKYVIEELELAKRLYQGHVFVTVKGHYREEELKVAAGSYYISMHQPLARVIAVLLEPECTDSLVSWGYFNRTMARQWSSEFGEYPVYRIHEAVKLEKYRDR